MKLLIVGCGYVGRELVETLPESCQVYALTRTLESARQLKPLGVEPVVAHWLHPDQLNNLPLVDAVLVSIPHRPDEAVASPDQTHCEGLQNLVEHLPGTGQRWVYLSTTGVYGDCDGQKVNELTPVSPSRIGPEIAVAAETWLRQNIGPRCHTILRLAGIYGPGRVPLASKLMAGAPLSVPQAGYLNLAHVSDIARVIQSAVTHPLSESTYVFSDGQPVPRMDFYRYLAKLCGVAEPQFEQPDEQDSRSRRATSKRIDPSRLVSELRYEYLFPSYREGLKSCMGAR